MILAHVLFALLTLLFFRTMREDRRRISSAQEQERREILAFRAYLQEVSRRRDNS